MVRKRIGKRRRILGAVKADAYGHGLVPISQALLRERVEMLGVALMEEGIELRRAGISAPILVMGGLLEDQLAEAFHHHLIPVLHDATLLPVLRRLAREAQKPLPVHLKVDTGMGRLGLSLTEAAGVIKRIKGVAGIHLEGLMTHFAEAEAEDQGFLEEQSRGFQQLADPLLKGEYPHLLCHTANSAAILGYPPSYFQMVRPGLMLYGYIPLALKENPHGLKPVLSLKTKIVQLKRIPPATPVSYGRTWRSKRESLIATLPLGYADGYPRLLSNRGSVLLKGRRLPIVGRVCMDMLMIDATEVPGARVGDEVILIGRDGQERITADEIADLAGTISYEILCGISKRIPRFYIT
jgi:alanine racemase